MDDEHTLIVAVEDGHATILGSYGHVPKNLLHAVGTIIGRTLGELFDRHPEPTEDGLWSVGGKITYNDGRSGYRPVEPEYYFDGEASQILDSDHVRFQLEHLWI